jgi:hypothetical protein
MRFAMSKVPAGFACSIRRLTSQTVAEITRDKAVKAGRATQIPAKLHILQ